MQFFLKMRGRAKNKKGFTLIELLIVIAILAILALLGLPRLAQFVSDSEAAEARGTGEVIGRAAEAVLAANGGVAPAAGDVPGVLEPYLTPETYGQIGEYTISITDAGVTITHDDEGVVYDSTTS